MFFSALRFLSLMWVVHATLIEALPTDQSGPQCVNWGVYERKAVRVYEGEAGRIHCPLFSHPKLYNYAQVQSMGHTLLWYKHTQELEEPVDLSLPKFVKHRDALWIQPASMQDTGEYICILRNMSSCVKIGVRLDVVPRKGDCNHTLQFYVNVPLLSNFTLRCPNLQHLPNKTHNIIWYHNCQSDFTDLNFREADGDEVIINQMFVLYEGPYTCVVTYQSNGHTFNYTHTINLRAVSNTGPKEPKILNPTTNEIYTVTVGKNAELACCAFLPYLNDEEQQVWWSINNKTLEELSEPRYTSPAFKVLSDDYGDQTVKRVLNVSPFKEEDLHKEFRCSVQNSKGFDSRATMLKEEVKKGKWHPAKEWEPQELSDNFDQAAMGSSKQLPSTLKMIMIEAHKAGEGYKKITKCFQVLIFLMYIPSVELGCGLGLTLVLALLLFVLYRVFWLEVHLLYRSWFGTDERDTDDKEYDVYISYARNTEEEEFVMTTLRRVLEVEFGYTVCIFDRDSLPGGTVTEETLQFVSRSRRLLVILSACSAFRDAQALLEVRAGVSAMLRGGSVKLVLIQFKPTHVSHDKSHKQDTHKCVKELRRARIALALVRWEGEKSTSISSHFWKKLRLQLPIRTLTQETKHTTNETSYTDDKEKSEMCAASVEDCCLAVGNVVGHENIVSASRMNSAIVVFLNEVEKYTLNVTRNIVRSRKALEIEIVELQHLEATRNQGHIEALKSKKAKMNDLLDITAQEVLVRSCFKSAAEMDAPSKFFFSLEQKNGQKRFIHAVQTESGDLLSEPTEICKQTVNFYSKLYSSEWSGAQVVEDSFLVGLPKLSERAARELDREQSLEELHEALQRMKNGRASGIDGLPAEFYKAFWAVIGQDVLDVLRDRIRREVNWAKSEAILVWEWGGQRPTLPGGLVWKKDGFKYLGVYLGNNEFLNKNWEGTVEHVKGRLSRWKRLVPRMSYRGRTLVINNLPASSLWHKLACVDLPPNLLASIQALLVDFFWDVLHRIPQSVLHLPKEEGGQGLVQLASRTAAFRLQFLQRLLTGPKDLIWRPVAHRLLHKVGGLGLDRTLFLMDIKTLDVSGLPSFYRGLFKIWNCFRKQNKGCGTLHWLLEEPLIHGGRLDISGVTAPALSRVLISSRVVTLRELVNIAGTDLSQAEDLAARLGLRSLRVVNRLLRRWRTVLTSKEHVQLMDYQFTETNPAEEGSFPQLDIAPDLDGSEGPLLECRGVREMDFGSVSGKLLYRACVKVLPWRSVLGFNADIKPEWRALYKPPLTKRAADLQWRILHDVAECVLRCMQASRRLMVVLSGPCVCEKSVQKLECGLCVYLHGTCGTPLITVRWRRMLRSPCCRELAALRRCAMCVHWHGDQSKPPTSPFWKRLRLALPARPLALGPRLIDSTSSHSDLAAVALRRTTLTQHSHTPARWRRGKSTWL
ncbi:hypothetical protein QTP70_018192 [Hemibagrus guttatus]|uniref:Interleukin-1 receptor accessory protein n=1 Tax=Hemibagrus guttatus TaxID=175788 RepID=A0AAE0QS70_9TELE|nr:hypothetical protein QTP70_018192 [Hemibagrus guttatus]